MLFCDCLQFSTLKAAKYKELLSIIRFVSVLNGNRSLTKLNKKTLKFADSKNVVEFHLILPIH